MTISVRHHPTQSAATRPALFPRVDKTMRMVLLGLALMGSSAAAVMAAPPTTAQKDEFYRVCMGIADNQTLCSCKADAAMTLIDDSFMAMVIGAMKGASVPQNTYVAYNTYVAKSNQVCKPNY